MIATELALDSACPPVRRPDGRPAGGTLAVVPTEVVTVDGGLRLQRERVDTLANSRPEEIVVDPVDIDFKPALRLPSWWILVPVAVATFAFWAVVLTDGTPESPPVALSLGEILVEPGFEEQRVRGITESYLDDVRECHTRLRSRLEGPVHIPLHLVVQPSGIVGSAGLKYGVAERSELADCVVEKATQWKFPRPSIPHFVGVTIHIELSPSNGSRTAAAL